MAILLMLIPLSLILFGIAIFIFIRAVRNGQFDDMDTPALDILADNDAPMSDTTSTFKPTRNTKSSSKETGNDT